MNSSTILHRKTVSTHGIAIVMVAVTHVMNYAAVQESLVHKSTLLLALFYCATSFSEVATAPQDPFQFRFYAGGSAGYGSTTWQGLVPSEKKQNIAINMSTPISTTEGGGVYGAFSGYEFTPYFALEAAYMHFPNAVLSFDETSLFAFDHEDKTELTTQTEMISFMGKIMLVVPKTKVRVFSSFGIADIHRDDVVKNQWRVAPTFAFGANYNVTPHIMTEISANYAAGYGESEISPIDDYIPFLYGISFKLAYRI